jgi:hypothetical protein
MEKEERKLLVRLESKLAQTNNLLAQIVDNTQPPDKKQRWERKIQLIAAIGGIVVVIGQCIQWLGRLL